MKKMNKKGFTLMEMLIVVAIIAILIAIAIPTFSATLEKSRESTDAANIRAAYAEAMADMLTNDAEASATADITQKEAGWSNTSLSDTYIGDSEKGVQISSITIDDSTTSVEVTVATDGTVTIA